MSRMFCNFITCVLMMRQSFLAEVNKVFFPAWFLQFWQKLESRIERFNSLERVYQVCEYKTWSDSGIFSHYVNIQKWLCYPKLAHHEWRYILHRICTCMCSTGNVPYTYLYIYIYIYIIIFILFILFYGDNEQKLLLSEELRLRRG